jgi:hypothetical protein
MLVDKPKNWVGQKPRYPHSCKQCTFLGFHLQADLYVHATGPSPVLVARYSPHDNGCDIGFSGAFGENELLTEARRRAEQIGALRYDPHVAAFFVHSLEESEIAAQALRETHEYRALVFHKAKDFKERDAIITRLMNASELRRLYPNDPLQRLLRVHERFYRMRTLLAEEFEELAFFRVTEGVRTEIESPPHPA